MDDGPGPAPAHRPGAGASDAGPGTGRQPDAAPGTGGQPELAARIGADVIDLVVLVLAYLVVSFAVGALAAATGAAERLVDADTVTRTDVGFVALNTAVNLVVQLAYWGFVEGRDGRSLGKRLTGLRVVRTDGEPVGRAGAVERKLPFYAPMALIWVPYASVVAFPAMLLAMAAGVVTYVRDHPAQRGFHDRWADTLVVAD